MSPNAPETEEEKSSVNSGPLLDRIDIQLDVSEVKKFCQECPDSQKLLETAVIKLGSMVVFSRLPAPSLIWRARRTSATPTSPKPFSTE
jgi:hypothetical protein